jgi:hypothetical protein
LIDKWRELLRRAGCAADHQVVEVGADTAKGAADAVLVARRTSASERRPVPAWALTNAK